MQVKKFEAKNMKDALAMVKVHLGPEAIILSAKENSRSFGLAGEGSVEVTAAVSEETLLKKKLAESKLNEKNKQQYSSSTARTQIDFINKVFNQYRSEKVRPAITQKQYVNILEDEGDTSLTSRKGYSFEPPDAVTQASAQQAHAENDEAINRIKSAAMDAFKAVQQVAPAPELKKPVAQAPAPVAPESRDTINALQKEIHYLRGLVEKFQNVPQNFLSMHPGAHYGIPFELSFMFEKLTRVGVSEANTVEILNLAQKSLPPENMKVKAYVSAWVAKYFLNNLKINQNWMGGRYHIFVGPAGQGKTTSLVKLASHLVINEKKSVAIITGDISKVGAPDQLKIYSQILNVSFAEVRSQKDWEVLKDKLSHVDHVLVDLPGKNLKNEAEIEELTQLMPQRVASKTVHFVQSILTKDSDAFEVAERFNKYIGFNDVIFTRLDESTQQGLIYNFQKKFGTPLHSFGIGTQIPEDFEPATKERVVDLFFKLTKLRKDGNQ